MADDISNPPRKVMRISAEEDMDGFKFTRQSRRLRVKVLNSKGVIDCEVGLPVLPSVACNVAGNTAACVNPFSNQYALCMIMSCFCGHACTTKPYFGTTFLLNTKVKNNNHGSSKKSATKNSVKRANKRRSSFVRGRKQRKSLVPPTPTADTKKPDLLKDIPSELPLEGRVRMLFDASLQLALNKLEEQSHNEQLDIPDFNSEAKAVFEHLRQVLSDSDIIEVMQKPAQEIDFSQIRNEQAEKDATACQAIGTRLSKEGSQWDELLHTHQELADKVSKEIQEDVESTKSREECPDFLSSEQHQLLSGKPSIKHIADRLECLKQRKMLQVDRVCQVVTGLKQYKDATESFVQKQISSFGAKTLEAINEMGTPRNLIRSRLNRQ